MIKETIYVSEYENNDTYMTSKNVEEKIDSTPNP